MDRQTKTEIIAGFTTFLTMAYIVVVNPSILSTEGTGIPFSGALTATVLLCLSMTLLMGLYAKLPFAVGPGMGINALFTYTIILKNQVPWPIALGIVFWSGILFLACSLTPIRQVIAEAIPKNLRFAVATGIGLFLTFIGLRNLELIVAAPVTFVKFGELNEHSIFALIGLAVMVLLMHRKNPLAFIVGIGLITGLSFIRGDVHAPASIWSLPDFSSMFLKLDIWGALQLVFLPSIVTIFFTDLFDSISTLMGCSYSFGMLDKDGKPKNLKQGLIVDAWATTTAGLFGTSAGTTFVESAAGIEAGGRRGLTAVVTGLCFIPCLFLAPIAAMVPAYATAPVLILVGALMFKSATQIQIGKLEELVPAFLTVVLIPLSFSITQGILWGIVSHTVLFVLVGRRREVSLPLYTLSALCVALLVIENWH